MPTLFFFFFLFPVLIVFSNVVESSEVSRDLLLNDFVKPQGLRERRYVIRAKRWKKHTLTWQLQTQNLVEADVFIVRNTMHRAFNEWASVSSLDFREIPPGVVPKKETPDIYIAFEKGEHSDGFPFDGRDGVVAHAFYPRDGRLHFDAEEQWSLNSPEGVNLFQTAVHEIGHLLGLEHSMDVRAAMFAAKRPYEPAFTLGDDDVRAIRSLFPKRSSATTEEPPTTPSSGRPEEEDSDPFDETSTVFSTSPDSFFPFPLPSIEHFQRRNDWFVL